MHMSALLSISEGNRKKILYDQDRVLISRENLGDLMLTRKFQTFVREAAFPAGVLP